jgi:hypothetical protein
MAGQCRAEKSLPMQVFDPSFSDGAMLAIGFVFADLRPTKDTVDPQIEIVSHPSR